MVNRKINYQRNSKGQIIQLVSFVSDSNFFPIVRLSSLVYLVGAVSFPLKLVTYFPGGRCN